MKTDCYHYRVCEKDNESVNEDDEYFWKIYNCNDPLEPSENLLKFDILTGKCQKTINSDFICYTGILLNANQFLFLTI